MVTTDADYPGPLLSLADELELDNQERLRLSIALALEQE